MGRVHVPIPAEIFAAMDGDTVAHLHFTEAEVKECGCDSHRYVIRPREPRR